MCNWDVTCLPLAPTTWIADNTWLKLSPSKQDESLKSSSHLFCIHHCLLSHLHSYWDGSLTVEPNTESGLGTVSIHLPQELHEINNFSKDFEKPWRGESHCVWFDLAPPIYFSPLSLFRVEISSCLCVCFLLKIHVYSIHISRSLRFVPSTAQRNRVSPTKINSRGSY